jgi:hypothetical protein
LNIITEITHIKTQLDFLVSKFSGETTMTDLTALETEVKNALIAIAAAKAHITALTTGAVAEAANTVAHVANLQSTLHTAVVDLQSVLPANVVANTVSLLAGDVKTVETKAEGFVQHVEHLFEKVL